MRRSGSALLFIALLAGCGGFAPSVPASPAVPQAGHLSSWMGKGLKQRDLLYVSNSNGTVNVYRYWQRTLVGILTDFQQPLGMCADRAGDVYISDFARNKIYEYAHGGQKAIRTFDGTRFGEPYACSVDPKTGSLAVMNYSRYYTTPSAVAIYPPGSKSPTIYKGTDEDHFVSCAYDDRGDLFILSDRYFYSFSYPGRPAFYYIPLHGTGLLGMELDDPNSPSGWIKVESLAWDGKYWVVEGDDYYLDRFRINVNAVFVSATQITPTGRYQGPIAFYRKNLTARASQVVAESTTVDQKGYAIDYWLYPAGGDSIHDITQDLVDPYGVAISMGKP